MKAWLTALMVLGAAWQASAAPAAIVEGVQMPAWIDRDGRSAPLAPGVELRAGDHLRTGADARVVLRLGEGSAVKLGENAALRIAELAPSEGVFRSAIRVLQGAFRFTTAAVAKQRRRDVQVTVGTVTLGIRGTDVWGRSRDERQIVCLIEGNVEVGAPGEPPVVLDQPRQFYRRDQGQTQPLGFVEPQQLAEWARETEIDPGKGAAQRGGRWRVQLLSTPDMRRAMALSEQLRESGYPAGVYPDRDRDTRSYRVRIHNLGSRAQAQALAARLHDFPGVSKPTVLR
jgi:cell division septation protein DedD